MTILAALNACAANEHCHLTPQECRRAHDLIIVLNNRYEEHSSVKTQDSQMVNTIKWTGRGIVLVISAAVYWFAITTWQWNSVYLLVYFFLVQMLAHAMQQVFEWWHK